MNAARIISVLSSIDIRRRQPKERAGQNDQRPTSLDSAAVFSRHFQPLRPRAYRAQRASDAPACGTTQRPRPSTRERERCGSSGLRSVRDHRRARQLPARPGNRRQRGDATDLIPATPRPAVGRFDGHQRGHLMATSGEKSWPPVGNFVAASGEKPMAIDKHNHGPSTRASTGRPNRGNSHMVPRSPAVPGR